MSSKREIKHAPIESESEEISEYYDSSKNENSLEICNTDSDEFNEYYDSDNSSESSEINDDGSEDSIKSYINTYNSYENSDDDTDNFLKNGDRRCKFALEEILVENSTYSNRQYLVLRLLEKELIKNICTMCNIGPEWKGKKLVLQLDHINGTNNDNRINNLRLLCPNCHTQTDTFGGKNKLTNQCVSCEKKITKKHNKCDKCYKKEGTRTSIRKNDNFNKGRICSCGEKMSNNANKCGSCKKKFNPSKEELENMLHIQKLSHTEIGKKYEVSRVTVNIKCKKYGILPSINNKIEIK